MLAMISRQDMKILTLCLIFNFLSSSNTSNLLSYKSASRVSLYLYISNMNLMSAPHILIYLISNILYIIAHVRNFRCIYNHGKFSTKYNASLTVITEYLTQKLWLSEIWCNYERKFAKILMTLSLSLSLSLSRACITNLFINLFSHAIYYVLVFFK